MNPLLQQLLDRLLTADKPQGPHPNGGVIPSSQWGNPPAPPSPKLPGLPPLPGTQTGSAPPPPLPPPPAPHDGGLGPGVPTSAQVSLPKPPLKVDPASLAAFGIGSPSGSQGPSGAPPAGGPPPSPSPMPMPAGPTLPADPSLGNSMPPASDAPFNAGSSIAGSGLPPMPSPPAPPMPPMSTPGSPMMGADPSQGLQGPDNMALPDPLDSTPSLPMMDGLSGQSPMLKQTGNEPNGGGDLVSLIKKLLRHNRA